MRTRSRILLTTPALLILLVGGLILALPGFVSSARHRATIEALASSLTGRTVQIGGKLSLALLPAPQLIAEQITISGADGQTITASSLTLDIAVAALAKGRLSASSLTLQSPHIDIPWPLAANRAQPPGWLTNLHAQIADGAITIGQLALTHVNADIFTGAGGALALSGTATDTASGPLDLSLSLGAADATGAAPVAADIKTGDPLHLAAHITGTLRPGGTLTGQLTATAAPTSTPATTTPFSASADLAAGPDGLNLTTLQLRQGPASLTGGAGISFATRQITAKLAGKNLDLAALAATLVPAISAAAGLNIDLDFTAADASIAGAAIPALTLHASAGAAGITLDRLQATLPGGATLSGNGAIDAAGSMTGAVALSAPQLPALFSAYLPLPGLPANWTTAHLTAQLNGDRYHLAVTQLGGTLGPSHLSGSLVFTQPDGRFTGAGAIHFDQIDLTALATLRAPPTIAGKFSLEGELTADYANIGAMPLTRLLVDASLGQQLTIRRASATLFGGMAAASLNISPGQMIAARASLSLPSAAPLLAAVPAAWRPPLPPPLAQGPLAISLAALGPPDALATSAAATLSDMAIAAAPVLDLASATAVGPLTLRTPSAITTLAAFGYHAGLGWPGAGSLALRADIALAPGKFGLPDFSLSFGDLTANGTFSLGPGGRINADIDADTIALPPLPPTLPIPWTQLATLQGNIVLRANQTLLDGQPILGRTSASLTLAPGLLTLSVPQAQLAGGTLTARLTAATTANTAPALTATVSLTGADAGAIALPLAFPLTLPSGALTMQANLTANGYAAATWAATLSGDASLTAANGTLNGFALAAIAPALALPPKRKAALTNALQTGTTSYSTVNLAAHLTQGTATLTTAQLQSPAGSAAATGSIDLPDQVLALKLTFAPLTNPPLSLTQSIIGPWANAKKIPALGGALDFKAGK